MTVCHRRCSGIDRTFPLVFLLSSVMVLGSVCLNNDDDIVDAVDIDRVLGFPPVETVDTDKACGIGSMVRSFGRRRRVGTVCHVFVLLVSLHERAI